MLPFLAVLLTSDTSITLAQGSKQEKFTCFVRESLGNASPYNATCPTLCCSIQCSQNKDKGKPPDCSKAIFHCGNPWSNNYQGKKECKWPKDKKIKFDDKGKYCYNEDEFAKACKSIVGKGHCPPGSSSWCADGVGFPTPPTTPLPLTSSPPDSSSGRQQEMMNLYLFFGFFITFMTYF